MRSGGLGGLGGFSVADAAGDFLGALGPALLAGNRYQWVNPEVFAQGIAAAHKRQGLRDSHQAIKSALKAVGFSDEDADTYAANPDAAKLVLEQRNQERQQKAAGEVGSFLGGLYGGQGGGAGGAGKTAVAPETFAPLFAAKEAEYRLPSGYLAQTAKIESSFNPNAKNPRSSAGGLFQFLDSTAEQYGLDNKFDPVASTDAAARLARDNAAGLRQALGREPTAPELYLAHQQGLGGARAILGNPDAPVASLVGGQAAALNGGAGLTGREFSQKWMGAMGGGVPVQTAQANPADLPVAGGQEAQFFIPTARSVLQAGEDAARRRESALWDAVDADGSLTVPMLPTRQAVHEIYGNLAQAKQIGLKPVERQILEVVGGYDAIEPFREIVGLRSALSSAMREELRNAGRTEAYGRMAALRSGLESNILDAAKSKAAAEFDAIQGGSMSVEDTLAARLQRQIDEWGSAGQTDRQDPGQAFGRAPLGREGAPPSAFGGSQQGPLPGPAGNSGLQAPAERGRPLSLTQFIAKNGGIELDADAKHYGWDQAKVGGYGRLARPGGVPVDRLRERLMEEGYLRPEPDGTFSRDIRNELYELVDAELKAGRKTYPVQHEGRMGASADPDADLAQAARQIVKEHEAAGVRAAEMDRGAVEEAAELLARGDEADPITAYERAVVRREGEGEPAVLSRPDPVPYTPRAAAPLPNALELDEAAYGRLKAASDATRERARTYRAGASGQILRKAGDSASYRMPDANVAANVFRPGRDGGERLRAFLASTRNSTEAREAVQEYAAASLRKTALKDDGTIDPARLSRWRNQHAEALTELPVTVRAKFSDAGRAANALAEATARRKEQIQAYQKSVLGKVAGIDPDDLPRVLGRILGSDDAAAKTRLLLREVKKDPDALKGLRRAVAEHVQERFISNKEVAASGENAIRADALQSFVRKARPALTQILEPQGVRTLEAIADDIARSERSLSALKIPSGSNTAQDTARFFEKLANPNLSIFAQISAAAAPAMALQNYKAAAGTAAAVGVKALLSKVRSAGMQKVDDLVVEMMLDPALARAALTRAANPAANEKLFTRQLERSLASGALYGAAP